MEEHKDRLDWTVMGNLPRPQGFPLRSKSESSHNVGVSTRRTMHSVLSPTTPGQMIARQQLILHFLYVKHPAEAFLRLS